MQNKIFTAVLVTILCTNIEAQNPPKLGNDNHKAIIEAMTLDEKVRLLVGMGMKLPPLHLPINLLLPIIRPPYKLP